MNNKQFSELHQRMMIEADSLLSGHLTAQLWGLRSRGQQAINGIGTELLQFRQDLQQQGFPQDGVLSGSETQILLQQEDQWIETLEQQVRPPPLTLDTLEQQASELLSALGQQLSELLGTLQQQDQIASPLEISPLTPEQRGALMLSLEDKLLECLVKNQKALEEAYLFDDLPLKARSELEEERQRYTLAVEQAAPMMDDFTMYSDDVDPHVSWAIQSQAGADTFQIFSTEQSLKQQVASHVDTSLRQQNLLPAQEAGMNDEQRQQRHSARHTYAAALTQSFFPQIMEFCKNHQYMTVESLKKKMETVKEKVLFQERRQEMTDKTELAPKQTNEVIIGLLENHKKVRSACERMIREAPQWATNVVRHLEQAIPPITQPAAPTFRQHRSSRSIQIAQDVGQERLVRNFLTERILDEVKKATMLKVHEMIVGYHDRHNPNDNLSDDRLEDATATICQGLMESSFQDVIKDLKNRANALIPAALNNAKGSGSGITQARTIGAVILHKLFVSTPDLIEGLVADKLGSELSTSDIRSRIVRELREENSSQKKRRT